MAIVIQLYAANGIEVFKSADSKVYRLAINALEGTVPVLAFDFISEKG